MFKIKPKNVTVESIVQPFLEVVKKLEDHSTNMDTTAAMHQQMIEQFESEKQKCLDQKAKAIEKISKLKEIFG